MRGAMPGPAACLLCGRIFERHGRGGLRAYCKRCTARADREIAVRPVVQCGECGSEFSAPRRSFRYCSDACRTEAARRRNLEHQRKYMADPEKRAITAARARAKAARAARKGGGGPQRRAASPRAGPNAEPSVCRLCGRTFAQHGRGWRAYCKGCTAKFDREAGRTLRAKCKECGKAFSTARRSVRYCSDGCSAEGLRRSYRESKRRIKADPERRALAAAQGRAWSAAHRGRKAGG